MDGCVQKPKDFEFSNKKWFNWASSVDAGKGSTSDNEQRIAAAHASDRARQNATPSGGYPSLEEAALMSASSSLWEKSD